jgi:hypothetical protein
MPSVITRRFIVVATLAFVLLACVGFVLEGLNYQRGVAAGSHAPTASLHRARILWLAGALGAAGFVLLGSFVVVVRRSISRPYVRALLDLVLVGGFVLAGPVVVSSAIALTQSGQAFPQHIFPGPLLLWSPSVLGAIGISVALSGRQRTAA